MLKALRSPETSVQILVHPTIGQLLYNCMFESYTFSKMYAAKTYSEYKTMQMYIGNELIAFCIVIQLFPYNM